MTDAPEFALTPLDPSLETVLDDPERWEAAMVEICDYAADEAEQAGLAWPQARRIGARIARRLCQEMGGVRYYWPRGDAFERAVRDLQIWEEFDGTVDGAHGISVLSRRHGMSDIHLYRIIARQRALHRQRVQPELPGLFDPPEPRR